MTITAEGTFDVTITPAAPELDGSVSRLALAKRFPRRSRGCGRRGDAHGGSGELEGITGHLDLTIEPDGTHRFQLSYEQ